MRQRVLPLLYLLIYPLMLLLMLRLMLRLMQPQDSWPHPLPYNQDVTLNRSGR